MAFPHVPRLAKACPNGLSSARAFAYNIETPNIVLNLALPKTNAQTFKTLNVQTVNCCQRHGYARIEASPNPRPHAYRLLLTSHSQR